MWEDTNGTSLQPCEGDAPKIKHPLPRKYFYGKNISGNIVLERLTMGMSIPIDRKMTVTLVLLLGLRSTYAQDPVYTCKWAPTPLY